MEDFVAIVVAWGPEGIFGSEECAECPHLGPDVGSQAGDLYGVARETPGEEGAIVDVTMLAPESGMAVMRWSLKPATKTGGDLISCGEVSKGVIATRALVGAIDDMFSGAKGGVSQGGSQNWS